MNAYTKPLMADEATIRQFLEAIHEQAARAFEGVERPGYLQLVRIDPQNEKPVHQRFKIGDVEGMARAAAQDAANGHNVYIEGRTISENAPRTGRGEIEHTRGVFALVVDSDADKGRAGQISATPSLVVETSPGNRHLWFFLDRAAAPEEAQKLGAAIRGATGADADTGVITQPYRVAGTPNYPSPKKQARGRAPAPTWVVQHAGTQWAADNIREAFPEFSSHSRADQRARKPSGLSTLTALPLVAAPTSPEMDRSGQFHDAVRAAVRAGMTPGELEVMMRQYPHGCAGKYLHPRDRLRQQIDHSWSKIEQEWDQVEGDAPSSGEGAEAAPIIEATPFEWIEPSTIPPRAWIYNRHYIRKFISTTVAPGGVGKTALEVVEALTICTGKPLLGVTPEEQTNVWLWNGEDPLEELQRRVMAAALYYDLKPSDLVDRLFLDAGRAMPIVIATKTKDGAHINAPAVQQVITTIKRNKIGVLSIDPFVSCHRVTENDNSEIERVAKAWAQIADETNCAIELVHHVRKTNGHEVGVEDGRGAVALLAAARSARALNRMTSEEAARAGVKEPHFYFRTDNGKANLAPPASKASWYFLASQDLGNATAPSDSEPARPSDKVGVVTSWEWPDHTADVRVSDMHAVRTRVAQGKWRADQQSPSWVGYAILEALGITDRDTAAKAKAKALQAMWIQSKALEEYQDEDERRRLKMFVRPGPFND